MPDDAADMVCINETRRRLTLIERAIVLGISLERATFLSVCSCNAATRAAAKQAINIPYDPIVQLREAARLGISARDTAEMMQMTYEEVVATGFNFPRRSTLKRPPGQGRYCLFQFEPHYKRTIYGKNH